MIKAIKAILTTVFGLGVIVIYWAISAALFVASLYVGWWIFCKVVGIFI